MIVREKRDSIAILRLAHGKANALDTELLGEIIRELDAVGEARAVVLTGTGSIFSAGVDLFRILSGGRDYLDAFLPALSAAVRALFELPIPVVAATNGHAVAGGCILVEACDYRIMSGGRIGVPELLVGVPFPVAALEIVRFAVPPHHIQKVAYTGATFTPEEALAHGLIDEIAAPDALLDRAMEIATQFAAVPPESFALAKRTLREQTIRRIDESRLTIDAEVTRVWQDPKIHDVIRGYLDRTVGKK